MIWGLARRSWVVTLGLAGCAFDTSGLGLGDTATDGDATDSTSDTTSNAEVSADVEGDPEAGSATSSTSTGEPESVAVLELSDPEPHGDFGPIDLGESEARAFVVTNVGTAPANNLAWSGVTEPFVFVGGSYPGASGNCSHVLDAGESCLLVLAFEPKTPGPAQAQLGIHYQDDGGSHIVSRELVGGGIGSTDTLLVNGDAEDCPHAGAIPPNWELAAGTGWRCGSNVQAGSFSFFGGDQSGAGLFELRQDVTVTAFADVIDLGALGIELSGWGRRTGGGDDSYHIDVVYLGEDENAGELAGWTSGVHSAGIWLQHTHARTLPAGTRTISVRLFCVKKDGNANQCDAYFDELELRLVYPPR